MGNVFTAVGKSMRMKKKGKLFDYLIFTMNEDFLSKKRCTGVGVGFE